MNTRIAVLPGDGIGPEIMPQAVRVLETIGQVSGHTFELTSAQVGGSAIDTKGLPLPVETLDLVKSSDAVLLGAVGGQKWEGLEYERRPERALLGLREQLGLFANLRPAKMYSSLIEASSLKPEVIDGIDVLVVRELTGGIYFGKPKGIEKTATGHRGFNTEVYTTEEIHRIAEVAFEAAKKRRGVVHSIDKANVLESSELWRREVIKVHEKYPDVELRHMYVDNCAMQLVRYPKQFDVIVTTNLFGDILSDEAAMLTGSIGMLPSASVGATVGMFEPIHGSAPDIAGKGMANPLGTIWSGALMLEHLGEAAAAQNILTSVIAVLNNGPRPVDLGGQATTSEVGDAVVQQISKSRA